MTTQRRLRSSQWYFTDADMASTPSIRTSYSAEQERVERSKGCVFIINVGVLLKMSLGVWLLLENAVLTFGAVLLLSSPQLTMATACVLFHRFYMRWSLRQYHYYEIGAPALFIASKSEETGRKLKDLIQSCAKVAQKNNALEIDVGSKEYWRWRDVILYNEELMLETLCFDLDVRHPYEDALELARQYAPRERLLPKHAWAWINDSYRTILCLIYRPRIVALAAVEYAMSKCGPNSEHWLEKEAPEQISEVRDALRLVNGYYRSTTPAGVSQRQQPHRSVLRQKSEFRDLEDDEEGEIR